MNTHILNTNKFLSFLAIGIAELVLKLSPQSTSAPGLLASKIAPNLLAELINSHKQSPVLITGTNGKSTTAGFFSSILKAEGLYFIHNRSGANLQSGILTTLIKSINSNPENILLEIDEAVLKKVTTTRKAKSILITNFFRDQLDRFGEINQTISLVQSGIQLIENGSLILNADDPNVCHLASNRQNTIYYGINLQNWNNVPSSRIFAEELSNCPVCHKNLSYRKQWLGQFGDYYCSSCGYEKPIPSVMVTELRLDPFESQVTISINQPNGQDQIKELKLRVPLPGLFNVYNALAAITLACTEKISESAIKSGIEEYQSLFGRSQLVQYKDSQLRLFLIKNPIGASEVLKLISLDKKAKVLIAINDKYADGRDVSWLWDANFEYLSNIKTPIFVTGLRASDMAVRLKYAHVKSIFYCDRLKTALDEFVSDTNDTNLYVLPTYTALLELTHIMELNIEKSNTGNT